MAETEVSVGRLSHAVAKVKTKRGPGASGGESLRIGASQQGEDAMTKGDIVDIVAEGTGLTKKETAAVIDGFLATIVWALQNGRRVTLVGFGTFRTKDRPPRKMRNPRSGQIVSLPERRVPQFVPSRELKARVNRLGEPSEET